MSNPTRNILLFLGPPGSGKGTLSQLCVNKLGHEQLSTGNLCRNHIAQQSEIGKKIDLILKSGKLIDDGLVTSMVTSWIEQNPQKQIVILDGYPRTIIQAELFNKFIVSDNTARTVVVHLAIPEHIVIQRLNMRLICSKRECQAVYSLLPNSSSRPQKEFVCDKCTSTLIRRPDDEIEAITQRLKLYTDNEHALLDFYAKQKYPYINIDAQHDVKTVFELLTKQLDRIV